MVIFRVYVNLPEGNYQYLDQLHIIHSEKFDHWDSFPESKDVHLTESDVRITFIEIEHL